MMISSVQSELFIQEGSSYPLIRQPIPESERIFPELADRLIHQATGLQVPGQLTAQEAQLIQQVTQHWDWHVDKNNKPTCAAQLLRFLEKLCATPSDDREVAP